MSKELRSNNFSGTSLTSDSHSFRLRREQKTPYDVNIYLDTGETKQGLRCGRNEVWKVREYQWRGGAALPMHHGKPLFYGETAFFFL